MKVLSIRQPYAWLIAIGCKTIENRTWNRKFRGRFLIHASQAKPEKLDGWQESAMKKYCQEHGIVIPDFKDLPTSAIIGSVELDDIQFHEAYPDAFAEDFQYHWFLKNAKFSMSRLETSKANCSYGIMSTMKPKCKITILL